MATVDAIAARRTARPRNWGRQVRKLHLFLGTFFAPAILFFAISGALQTFSWHERRPGDAYQPPVWIQKMGQLHKKQTLVLPVRRPPASASRAASGAGGFEGAGARRSEPEAKQAVPVATYLQKCFVFLMAIGLVFTTTLGLYMAFQFNPGKRAIWICLLIGALLPITFALA